MSTEDTRWIDLDRWLVARWKTTLQRAWSVRLALFWGAVCGLYAAWDAFLNILPAGVFALCSMVMCMAIFTARMTRQPGMEE